MNNAGDIKAGDVVAYLPWRGIPGLPTTAIDAFVTGVNYAGSGCLKAASSYDLLIEQPTGFTPATVPPVCVRKHR